MLANSTAFESIDAGIIYRKYFYEGLKPVPRIKISDWVDQRVYLSRSGNKEHGKIFMSRTPYMIDIINDMSPWSKTQYQCIMKGTQIAGTMGGIFIWGFLVDVAPASMCVMLPTRQNAQRHSKGKVQPFIDANPHIFRGRIQDARTRDSGNEMFHKQYPGGDLFIVWAGSPASLVNFSASYIVREEVDRYVPDVGGEGDPYYLIENRADTFGDDAKFLDISTPTLKGTSVIEAAFLKSDQNYYYVPCPFCGHKQWLRWKDDAWDSNGDFRIVFDEKNYELQGEVFYRCEKCKKLIPEHKKTEIMDINNGALWISHYPNVERRGRHISSLYSPLGWVSWKKIVKEFLDAKKNNDYEALKVWVNTRLAQTYDSTRKSAYQSDILLTKVEDYGPVVPMQAVVITAGVDVQKDRLEAKIKAWAPNEESWLMEYRIIDGDTEKESTWKELDDFLKAPWLHESGAELSIAWTFIDAGYKPDEVRKFVVPRQYRRMFASKGSQYSNKPIVAQPKRKSRAKMKEFMIGTDTAKDYIFNRMNISKEYQEDPETYKLLTDKSIKVIPRYMHYNKFADNEYFKQLSAEIAEKKKVGRYTTRIYTKIYERNEALDTEVLCLAGLKALNPDWKSIIESIARQAHSKKTGGEMPQAPKRITGRRIISRGIE